MTTKTLLVTLAFLALCIAAGLIYIRENYNLVSETEYHNLQYGIHDDELRREFDRLHP